MTSMRISEKNYNQAGPALRLSSLRGLTPPEVLYINIYEDKIQINAVAEIVGQDFFIRSLVKPDMENNNLILNIEKISVGKITIHNSMALFL